MTTQTRAPRRREARFLHDQVIVPTGVSLEAWYEVCAARRRDDRRSGMVLLNLGGSRMLVPDNCLEFRAARRPTRRSAGGGAVLGRILSRAADVVTRPGVAVTASLCMAVLAIGSLAMDR